jgi:hypothetical protein
MGRGDGEESPVVYNNVPSSPRRRKGRRGSRREEKALRKPRAACMKETTNCDLQGQVETAKRVRAKDREPAVSTRVPSR